MGRALPLASRLRHFRQPRGVTALPVMRGAASSGPASMDRRTPGPYLQAMRFGLHLLLIAALAIFAAGLGMRGSAEAAPVDAAAVSGQLEMMHMTDCDGCTAEQMQSGPHPCGSGCVPPVLAAFGIRDFQPVVRSAAGFPLGDDVLASQIRRPELSPPRSS